MINSSICVLILPVRLISHIRLGLHIIRKYPFGLIESLAYLFGNIQPDICAYSYLKGVAPGDEKRGHNMKTALMRIERMEMSMVPDGIAAAYTLGKITHYAADIFTYPHNPELFHGSLKGHMIYERVLDNRLEKVLDESETFLPDTVITGATPFLKELHKEYEKAKHSPMNDISYILSAAFILRTSFSYEAVYSSKRRIAIR